LPFPIFSDPYSTVISDRNQELLGARISDDGQWRFPISDSIPQKYKTALLLYEDKYYYSHPGINPVSLLKAIGRNIRAGRIVSGGSTISMQVMRLSRKGKSRNLYQKFIEMILALRMEFSYSKEEILLLYSAHAPYGGNIVGIEAASWRYFGRNASTISWSEAAMLAVLPNSPSLVRPGKNRDVLKQKRDRLLFRLFKEGEIDSLSYLLFIDEPIPDDPYPLPKLAPHLVEYFSNLNPGTRIQTSLNKTLQEKVERIMETQRSKLYKNEIHNAACLIIEVKSAKVLAYYGNIPNTEHPEYGGDVDIIHSARSSGSILKPILFAEMINRGELLPGTLIADIPTHYGGFSPKNNTKGYDGVVPARMALSRSLNIPAVRMLRQYGSNRFYHDLKRLGLTTLNYPAERYGLSLILGGAEARLWELAGVYSGFARILNHYNESSGKYFERDLRMPELLMNPETKESADPELEQGIIGAGAIYLTFKALLDVNRPEDESGWENFASTRRIAWKTGTSFGFRDAWAIGTTPEYTIAVWTGNANGEGRPGLTGLNTSAPVLFELFGLLPQTSWFKVPYDDLVKANVCSESGYLAGKDCLKTDSVWITSAGINTAVCPYHQLIHLNKKKTYRVGSDCYPVEDMVHLSWFILPPVQEWYFRQKNAWYKELPEFQKDCLENEDVSQMQMVYPEKGTIVYVPYELDGSRGRLICEAVHRKPGVEIFWHLDERYLGKTKGRHQMAILPDKGKHVLNLIDSNGGKISVSFEAIER
jgi:penicillin-binding protein 1C